MRHFRACVVGDRARQAHVLQTTEKIRETRASPVANSTHLRYSHSLHVIKTHIRFVSVVLLNRVTDERDAFGSVYLKETSFKTNLVIYANQRFKFDRTDRPRADLSVIRRRYFNVAIEQKNIRANPIAACRLELSDISLIG